MNKKKSRKNKKPSYKKMEHFEFFSEYSAEQFIQLLPSKAELYEDKTCKIFFVEKDTNKRFRIRLEEDKVESSWYCGEITAEENGCYIKGDIFYNPDCNKDCKPKKMPLWKKILAYLLEFIIYE